MRKMCTIASIAVLLFLAIPFSGQAAESLPALEQQLSDRISRFNDISAQILKLEKELTTLTLTCEQLRKQYEYSQGEHKRAQDAYQRAVQNPDLITPLQMSRILEQYQAAEAAFSKKKLELGRAEAEEGFLREKIVRLSGEQQTLNIIILETQAAIFDSKAVDGVWLEGYGEAILDENKTMKECERLALEYARRDALDKGGKAVIEALTVIDKLQVVSDTVKASSSVQIVDQDNSGEYGRVVKTITGDVIKFSVKVRLKVRSSGDLANPYRQKAEELKSKPASRATAAPAEPREPLKVNQDEPKLSRISGPAASAEPAGAKQAEPPAATVKPSIQESLTGTWMVRSVNNTFLYIDYTVLKLQQTGDKITGSLTFPTGASVNVTGSATREQIELTLDYQSEGAIRTGFEVNSVPVYRGRVVSLLRGAKAKIKLRPGADGNPQGEFYMWYAVAQGSASCTYYDGGTPEANKAFPPKPVKLIRMAQ